MTAATIRMTMARMSQLIRQAQLRTNRRELDRPIHATTAFQYEGEVKSKLRNGSESTTGERYEWRN
jgi:hypothetical protein